MPREDWYKKDVGLQWQGMTLSFAVAQELFSSHAVDTGSRLLLKSLEPDHFPTRGTALDFGCGYGVLGLAWKKLMPEWHVHLVDRDALAVEFTGWNAERLDLGPGNGVSFAVGLGPEGAPSEGFDLILWNVPGKAGETVLTRLADDVGKALSVHGRAVLVVVNPLAAALRPVYEASPELMTVLDAAFAGHTVLHIRKEAATMESGTPTGPFERGVFDRAPHAFASPAGSYTITPVVGLPEYESHSHETTLLLSTIEELSPSPHSLLVFGCGQGHIPVATHLRHGTARFTLIDRDMLALEASTRALAAAGVAEANVSRFARSGIGFLDPGTSQVDTAMIRLEDQLRPAVVTRLLDELEAVSSGGLTVIVGGGSTSVSRFLGSMAKRRAWKLRSRSRKRGASAAVLTVG